MKKILEKSIDELTAREFKTKYDMLKFDMGLLNLQKQSKNHLIKILKLYKEFKEQKNGQIKN